MKFGELIKYPKRNILLQKLCKNDGRKLVPVRFRVFFLSFILRKRKWFAAWFYYISIALKLAYNRNNLFKTLHYWSRDILSFDILDKSLEIVSPAHIVYDFSKKMFLMLYSINWSNFIVWLPSLLETLGNVCIATDF